MYHEEKREFRVKHQKVEKYLKTWENPKDQYYMMEMYIRKMGRNIQKMKDFHEWVIDMMDTKKMEQNMKTLRVKDPPMISELKVSKEFDHMYISPESSIDFTKREE